MTWLRGVVILVACLMINFSIDAGGFTGFDRDRRFRDNIIDTGGGDGGSGPAPGPSPRRAVVHPDIVGPFEAAASDLDVPPRADLDIPTRHAAQTLLARPGLGHGQRPTILQVANARAEALNQDFNTRYVELLAWTVNGAMGINLLIAGLTEMKALGVFSTVWMFVFAICQIAITASYESIRCRGSGGNCAVSYYFDGSKAIASLSIIFYAVAGLAIGKWTLSLEHANSGPKKSKILATQQQQQQPAGVSYLQQQPVATAPQPVVLQPMHAQQPAPSQPMVLQPMAIQQQGQPAPSQPMMLQPMTTQPAAAGQLQPISTDTCMSTDSLAGEISRPKGNFK